MTTLHKRLRLNFQVLLLVLLSTSLGHAKNKGSEVTPEKARTIIEEAAKKKDFSKEFKEIVAAPESVEKVLIEVLQTSTNRWEERWFCAITLGKRKSPQAKAALLKAVQDELFIVRQAAVQGLSYFDDVDTMAAIRNAMNDTAMVVRSEVVDAITKRNDVGAIDVLQKELYEGRNFQKGRSMWIRPQIIHAFGLLGESSAVDALVKALKDKDELVVTQSCKSLHTLSLKHQWEYPVKYQDCAQAWTRWYEARNEKSEKKEVKNKS